MKTKNAYNGQNQYNEPFYLATGANKPWRTSLVKRIDKVSQKKHKKTDILGGVVRFKLNF